MSSDDHVDVTHVLAARRTLAPHLCVTPVCSHPLLSEALGARAWVKLENAQPTGSFKIRGGLNLLSGLAEVERSRGVCAATRGNHGQSLAWACREHDTRCVLFVPEGNNPDKNAAMRAMGAEVVVAGRSFDEACVAAEAHASATGARLVHPGKDPALVAGVGTLALELLEQVPMPLDYVFVPVGVGSCIAGVALVLGALSPHTRIIGVQSEHAPAMCRAWQTGTLATIPPAPTVADGLAVGVPVPYTLELMRTRIHDMILVTERALHDAMRLYATTLHQMAEGAGAASLAGALACRSRIEGHTVALILSGGNLDLSTLRSVLAARAPVRQTHASSHDL